MTGRALLVPLLLTTALVGCSSQEETYCDAVKAHQVELGRTSDEGGPAAVLEELSTMEELAADAPTDIKDEWQAVITAVRGLDQAFEDADVDPATYDVKHPPAGLSDDDRQRIAAAAQALGSESVTTATSSIEQEALDVCKTPVGL
jgi:hypothetical protein